MRALPKTTAPGSSRTSAASEASGCTSAACGSGRDATGGGAARASTRASTHSGCSWRQRRPRGSGDASEGLQTITAGADADSAACARLDPIATRSWALAASSGASTRTMGCPCRSGSSWPPSSADSSLSESRAASATPRATSIRLGGLGRGRRCRGLGRPLLGRSRLAASVVVVERDHPIGEVEIAPDVGHRLLVDDDVDAFLRRQPPDDAHRLLKDRLGELVLLLLQLSVVFDEHRLNLHHLALPLLDPVLQRLLAEHALLLFDVLALFLQVGLLLVVLALAAVEHLLERGLSPQPVLRLHDGALSVDDGDLRLSGGR